MKLLLKRPMIIVLITIILVIVVALVFIIIPGIAVSPIVLPPLPTFNMTLASTVIPNQTQISSYLTQHPLMTTTKMVISKITDLSPNLSDEKKYVVVVAHPDGTNEEFKVGPVPAGSTVESLRSGTIPPDILLKVNLKDGDKVIVSYSILGMYSRIGPSIPSQEITLPATPMPPITQTPYSYP